MAKQELIHNLKEYFKERDDIAAAFVFGSCASGSPGPLSDIDIAVLFSVDVVEKEYARKELEIAGDIGRFAENNRVDVVNLATVRNPILSHTAIFSGIPLCIRDKKSFSAYARHIFQEYEDTRSLHEAAYAIMRRQLKSGSFGKAHVSR